MLKINDMEKYKLLSLYFLYFFLIFGNILGINIGNSIFLSSSSTGISKLPYMYISFAIITSIITFFSIFFIDRIKRDSMFLGTISTIFIITLLFFSFFRELSGSFGIILIYLTVQIIWLITIMQFWTIANDLCNTREAKRLFPLISSGGLTGSLISGFIVSYLLTVLKIKYLILIWSFSILMGIIIFGAGGWP